MVWHFYAEQPFKCNFILLYQILNLIAQMENFFGNSMWFLIDLNISKTTVLHFWNCLFNTSNALNLWGTTLQGQRKSDLCAIKLEKLNWRTEVHFYLRSNELSEVYLITVRNYCCGKVMFLHLSVILLTGGCLPLGLRGVHSPRQTPPRADTHTPPETATAGDGTHPTEMHSCL